MPVLDLLLETARRNDRPPVLELDSLAPGGGKTHLIYHLAALAILPAHLGGKQATVVIIDMDGSFCVARLAQQLYLVMNMGDKPDQDILEPHSQTLIQETLEHVHILQPQSLASTIASIQSLASYLFDSTRHNSFDRAVGFIALDSASAFYWQDRAESEDATLAASTTTGGGGSLVKHESGYAKLTSALKSACAALHCPAIITSWHLGPAPPPSHTQHTNGIVRSLRPSLLAPLSQLPTLRLIVQRVPVRKFPAGISVTEAMREASDRQKAVAEARFEAVVNEWGVDERMLQRLQQKGAEFSFRIKAGGLMIET